MRCLVLSLWLLIGLAGCASPTLTPDERSSIGKVSIADVVMPSKPTIFGERAAASFLLGGPLGLAMTHAGSDLPTLYLEQLQKHHIDVAALFKADLTQQFRQHGLEVVPHGQSVDAVVVPEIVQYGLTGDIFSSPPVRFPQLSVRLDVIRSDNGQRLWRGSASLNVLPDVIKQLEARPIGDYLQDGELLRGQVEKASKLIAAEGMKRF